ncbi:MAG: hypothetical protein HOG45_08885 [Deltaproteobacteria bacterium]|nr:hypothetical protein [Deltaproteobacteria bacterium]
MILFWFKLLLWGYTKLLKTPLEVGLKFFQELFLLAHLVAGMPWMNLRE